MGSCLKQACSAFALGLVLAVGTRASAQVSVLPPRPIPFAPGDVGGPPPGPLGPMVPPPSPLTYAPVPPPPPPVLDPGPDGWGPFGSVSANQGWFFDAEIVLVYPRLKYRATNDLPLPITGGAIIPWWKSAP